MEVIYKQITGQTEETKFPCDYEEEYIYVEYAGRGDLTNGTIAAAPTFQTGSEKYSWLNGVQAVIAGQVNLETGKLVYRLYEVKITAEEGLV